MPPLSTVYDVCLLDLDGVVYIGADAAPYACAALAAARADGMRLAFVTNNASRPPSAVAAHLNDLGIQTSAGEVVTSAQAAARMLADRLPAGAPVLVVGGEGLAAALTERGLRPVWSRADGPVAVAQGFHPDVDWTMLAEGAYAVGDGLPWVASNADTTIPRPEGIAPGNGALVQVIALATGRYPEVAGKPQPPMHTETVLRTGARRPLVVGDRLDTDIEGADGAGVDSLLVLSGVTSPREAVLAGPRHRPTYVGPDLRALAAEPAAVRVDRDRTAYGRWRATVTGGHVDVAEADATEVSVETVAGAGATADAGGREPGGNESGGNESGAPWGDDVQDGFDGLRAICAAVWAASDGSGEVGGVAAALKAVGW